MSQAQPSPGSSGVWRRCPWDYRYARCHVHGLVRLDDAPVRFAFGLLLERPAAAPPIDAIGGPRHADLVSFALAPRIDAAFSGGYRYYGARA